MKPISFFILALFAIIFISYVSAETEEELSDCIGATYCDECIETPNCGWCSGKCVSGTPMGPSRGSCSSWNWNSCSATPSNGPSSNPWSNPPYWSPSFSPPTNWPSSNPSPYWSPSWGPPPTNWPSSNPSPYWSPTWGPQPSPWSNPPSNWPPSWGPEPNSNPPYWSPPNNWPSSNPNSNPSPYWSPSWGPEPTPWSNPPSNWPSSNPAPYWSPSWGPEPNSPPPLWNSPTMSSSGNFTWNYYNSSQYVKYNWDYKQASLGYWSNGGWAAALADPELRPYDRITFQIIGWNATAGGIVFGVDYVRYGFTAAVDGPYAIPGATEYGNNGVGYDCLDGRFLPPQGIQSSRCSYGDYITIFPQPTGVYFLLNGLSIGWIPKSLDMSWEKMYAVAALAPSNAVEIINPQFLPKEMQQRIDMEIDIIKKANDLGKTLEEIKAGFAEQDSIPKVRRLRKEQKEKMATKSK